MFSPFSSPPAAPTPAAPPHTPNAPPQSPSASVLWTNMESNKVMCPTFSVMLVRTIKALCEINVRFDHKLEISGSLHVRSDGDKVMTCLIDEESIKGAQDLSILDAVRFTMPYAAAALAPMALPGGYQQPDALMSPAVPPQPLPDKDKVTNNGMAPRHDHVVNIVPEPPLLDMNLGVLGKPASSAEQEAAEVNMILQDQRRLSADTPKSDPKPPKKAAKTANHSTPSSSAAENHVKLPNIQTFAGMLPRLPGTIKTECKEAVSPGVPASSSMATTPAPPAGHRSASSDGFPSPPGTLPSPGYDPLVGVKIEVQSQVDSEGNVVQKKKFQCMFCGIFLSTKCYLKNHINAMHTKARVYPCEVCEKYFYSAGALRIHKLRNHWQGSKKHKCDHCGETFLLPIELRKHLLKKHSELDDAYDRPAAHTEPSSGSSSPRGGFPLGPALLAHPGAPVFPVPHTAPVTAATQKELVAAAAAAMAMDVTAGDLAMTHSAPVFPAPVPQSLALASVHKSAISASAISDNTGD